MKTFFKGISGIDVMFRLLSLSRNGQFSILEVDLNLILWEAREFESCCNNILLCIFLQIQSTSSIRMKEAWYKYALYLPWFEWSDHWAWSCFTILLRYRGIIQDTVDFKVEGLVEDARSHLCDLWLRKLKCVKVVFCECWWMREALRRLQYLYLFEKKLTHRAQLDA